ncbi:MAG TPA: response regulator [Chthonomonadaceae bacterium]|nr:response regulator [Chthonomonadaceae bacterium]
MSAILIVDDHEQNRYLLRVMLTAYGDEVLEAANGAEALELARRNPPDLIISDILMPQMDGFALCRECKHDAHLREIPFLFYTATYTDPRDQALAMQLGAARFIIKPIENEDFLAIVREVRDAHAAGQLNVPPPPQEEMVFYRLYNEALIRKLEDKMLEMDRLNRSLVESEARFRHLAENAQDVIYRYEFTPKPGFTYVSPAAVAITGYTPEEYYADPDLGFKLVYPDDRPLLEAARKETRSGQALTLRWVRKDGQVIWIEQRNISVCNAVGERIAMEGIARDVTDLKDLQQQLLHSQKMEAMGRLAGGIAHDFNNLLTVINGMADLALVNLKKGDPLRADLQEIHRAGERAAALTRQLLAFSRRQIMQSEALNLNAVLSDMQSMLRRLIGEDIHLKFVLGHHVGNVRADRGLIEQAIVNLVVNARDAMPNGGKITLETQALDLDAAFAAENPPLQPGAHVMLAISDTGIGMDEATRTRIFEPFFTTKEEGRGTGLGLSTVYGIVKQSGGSICVDSASGKGTSFKIYLPQVDELPQEPRPERPLAVVKGSETILIVEDDDALRDLARRILQSAGYTVLMAGNGEEALRRLDQHHGPVHLLLTDVIMPGMSGRDLALRLMDLQPQIKILYTSGYTDDAILQHGVLDETVSFLHKPYTVAELRRKVREMLDTQGGRPTTA